MNAGHQPKAVTRGACGWPWPQAPSLPTASPACLFFCHDTRRITSHHTLHNTSRPETTHHRHHITPAPTISHLSRTTLTTSHLTSPRCTFYIASPHAFHITSTYFLRSHLLYVQINFIIIIITAHLRKHLFHHNCFARSTSLPHQPSICMPHLSQYYNTSSTSRLIT